jgi:hypothetical protein
MADHRFIVRHFQTRKTARTGKIGKGPDCYPALAFSSLKGRRKLKSKLQAKLNGAVSAGADNGVRSGHVRSGA